MRFAGIDFGWGGQPSGLCLLEAERSGLELKRLDRLAELTEILKWVDEWVGPGPAIVAIDAPTIIPNQSGMRTPDRLAHRLFGRYHAGCYPANLGRPWAARTLALAQALASRGFAHGDRIEPRAPTRLQIEVFPHIAQIELFGLQRILKYKKGLLADRAAGLEQLRTLIEERFPNLDPPVRLAPLPPVPSGGPAVKALEDRLDALICAYAAAHWWYWGVERNQVLGSAGEGFLVAPRLREPKED